MALKILDRAIQVHGGAGVSDDFPLAHGLRAPAPCGSPTAPTRCTSAPSRAANCADVPRPACGGQSTMMVLELTRQDRDRHRRLPRDRVGRGAGARDCRRERGADLAQAGVRPTRRQPTLAAVRSAWRARGGRRPGRALYGPGPRKSFGSIDVLVNNAGTNPAFGSLIEQDHGRFAKTFDVNLWAPCCGPQLATKAWMGEHGGAVVNTRIARGLWARPAPSPAYDASKAGVASS